MGLLKRLLGRATPDSPREEGDWAVYMTQIEGNLASAVVDLRWKRRGPQRAMPVWVDVSVAFGSADERGMPVKGELAKLDPVDDRLRSAMRKFGGVDVGAWSVDGRRHWLFYAPREEVYQAVERAFTGRKGPCPQVRVKRDPEWKLYGELLYPDEQEMRQIKDGWVVDALARHNDIAERERKIEHWAFFGTEEVSRRFAAWAKDNGFVIEAMLRPEGTREKFGVRFSHVGPATLAVVNEKTVSCEHAATELGGEYDGWETVVVKESANAGKI